MKLIVEAICNELGGRQATAKVAGVGLTAISNWKKTGIPDAAKWRLHVKANQLGKDLDELLKEASVVQTKQETREPEAPAPGIAAE